MILEVIAKNIEDIDMINQSLADRIEFCINLKEGGLTPPFSEIKLASQKSKKQLMIMLRMHYDTFDISKKQIQELVEIIKKTRDLNFTGYVFGATKNSKLDIEALKIIMAEIPNKKEVTFHKAFDEIEDKVKWSKTLKEIGVTRILTSGGQGNPMENIETIKSLIKYGPEILVGGGVGDNNFKSLLKNNIKNIHIGRAARENNSWDSIINIETINEYKKLMEK